MIDSVQITMYKDSEELLSFQLDDVVRGMPELVEALETLTQWLPYNWVVRILFLSRRQPSDVEE